MMLGWEIEILNSENRVHLLEEGKLSDFIHELLNDSVYTYKISEFPVGMLNTKLNDHPYVAEARIFVSKTGLLKVECLPNYPAARVIPARSESYFVDYYGNIMPLSEDVQLRLPVVRGRVPDINSEREEDILKLEEIGALARIIGKSEFMTVLTDQILITALGDFVLIPSVGSEKIELGSFERMEDKIMDTEEFYSQVVAQTGWNVYEKISLKYEGQVVATRRDPATP